MSQRTATGMASSMDSSPTSTSRPSLMSDRASVHVLMFSFLLLAKVCSPVHFVLTVAIFCVRQSGCENPAASRLVFDSAPETRGR